MSYLACAGTASPHQVQAGELEENPKPHHFDHLKKYKSPFLKVYKTQAGQKPSLEVNITALCVYVSVLEHQMWDEWTGWI